MKKWLFLGGGSVAVMAALLSVSGFLTTQAANNRYVFVARGIVTSVDHANKTIKVDVTKAPGKAQDDLEGENKEFKTTSATVYKHNRRTVKDTRVTINNVAVGQEIGFKGAAKDDDTFTISFIRIHDRSFEVVGNLQTHTEGTRVLKILLLSTDYKPQTYQKGDEITMEYPEDATFYSKTLTNPVSFSEVDANAQKVKVIGTITNANTWRVTKLIDGYK